MQLIFSLFLTAMIYLTIPVIFVLVNRPLKNITIITISIINMLIGIFFASLLFSLLSGSLSGGHSGGSLFWTFIGYVMMKKRLLYSSSNNVSEKETDDLHCESKAENNISNKTPNNTKPTNPHVSKSKFHHILISILSILLFTSILFSIHVHQDYMQEVKEKQNLSQRISQLELAIDNISQSNNELEKLCYNYHSLVDLYSKNLCDANNDLKMQSDVLKESGIDLYTAYKLSVGYDDSIKRLNNYKNDLYSQLQNR